MTPEREIYPNAPLEYVACEVRFPFAPALAEDAAIARLHKSFYEWLPLVEPGFETTLVLGGVGIPGPQATVKQLRFFARDRRLGVLISPGSILVETTAYTKYEDFRNAIDRALTGLVNASDVAGLARIGLRYIDEIRVPTEDAGEMSGWSAHIDTRLTCELSLELNGRGPQSAQGTLQFDLDGGDHVVMRYGPMMGQSVGNAPLRRRGTGPGPYFLIDIDSYWAPSDLLPAFEIPATLDACDRLHVPVRSLFESSITDRLRNDVLRSAPRGI